ncbi:hypothetical protein MIMGU_mgv1a0167621mg, partial [Erythranthe guttata]
LRLKVRQIQLLRICARQLLRFSHMSQLRLQPKYIIPKEITIYEEPFVACSLRNQERSRATRFQIQKQYNKIRRNHPINDQSFSASCE